MRNRLAILLIFVLLVISCGDDRPAVTTTSGPAETPTVPSTVPSTLPSLSSAVRVPHDESALGGPGDQVMSGVVFRAPGLVAVGSDYEGGNGSDGGEMSDGDAAVWTLSPETATPYWPNITISDAKWARVPHDEAVFGGPGRQELHGVVRFRKYADHPVPIACDGEKEVPPTGGCMELRVDIDLIVAVGVDASGGDANAAVWTSPDGLTWSRVPRDEPVFGGPGDQAMLRVAAGDEEGGSGNRLVAVGYDIAGGDADAAVWTSPDGVTWSRVPHDEAIFGGPGDQEIQGVRRSGAVGWVAVGTDRSGEDVGAAVWISPDGLTWNRVPHDEAIFGGPGDQEIQGVEVFFSNIIAVGFDTSGGNADAAVWTSPDGVTWVRVADPESVFGGDGNQEISDVSRRESYRWNVTSFSLTWSLVAVGSDASGGDVDAAVWTSPDGLTWTRLVDLENALGGANGQHMSGLVSGGWAVGSDSSGGDWDAAVWGLMLSPPTG